ncbi:MAG: siderophore-interacting protein [Spirillospora sp.]
MRMDRSDPRGRVAEHHRLPDRGQDGGDWPCPLPRTRKYTVRRYAEDALELDLDFVLHPGGLASTCRSAS